MLSTLLVKSPINRSDSVTKTRLSLSKLLSRSDHEVARGSTKKKAEDNLRASGGTSAKAL